MAVVFISPKKRQRMFFAGITIGVSLFVVFVSLSVLFSGPKQVSKEFIFNRPKINIDMEFLDSEKFENLEPFKEMEIQYRYRARTKENVLRTGFITGTSVEEARKILTDMDLIVTEIEEAEIGRENPFSPYYELPIEQFNLYGEE